MTVHRNRHGRLERLGGRVRCVDVYVEMATLPFVW